MRGAAGRREGKHRHLCRLAGKRLEGTCRRDGDIGKARSIWIDHEAAIGKDEGSLLHMMRGTQHHQEEARHQADTGRAADSLERGAHRICSCRHRPADRSVRLVLPHHHCGKDERRAHRLGCSRFIDALVPAQGMIGSSKARRER